MNLQFKLNCSVDNQTNDQNNFISAQKAISISKPKYSNLGKVR